VTDVRNVIIIGSGPAGYTAAVYASRANLRPLLIEGSVTAGGALMNTTDVENYPGFRDGIMGPALMEEMRAQAERFGTEIITDDVTGVELHGEVKTVTTGDGGTFSAHAVILAMGSAYRELGLPDEKRLSGRGVSWCATCDGFFFRDQDIAVVGGGDSAIEEATFLTKFARSVTIVHRRRGPGHRHHPHRHAYRRGARAARHRPVHRHRPRPAQRAGQGPGRPRPGRVRGDRRRRHAPIDGDAHPRSLRLR